MLTSVMIFSGGLPLSIHYSTAQPLPPGAVKEQRPLNEVLEAYHQQINQELDRRNQALEEMARVQGRELQDSERVTVVREVILKPHPTSPVQDVAIIVYEFSDGTHGNYFETPVFQPWVTEPFKYEIDAMSVDEGWYIVRFATPEEMEEFRKAGEKPAATESTPTTEGEPLSFLDRVIGLFSPSEAVACGCVAGPYGPHSSCRPLYADVGPEVARDGVKMSWRVNAYCNPELVSLYQPLCSVSGGWSYLAPCPAPFWGFTFGQAIGTHDGTYESPSGPISGTRALIRSQVLGNNDGSWFASGSCSLSGGTSGIYNCDGPAVNDCF